MATKKEADWWWIPMQSQKCFKLETGKMDERDFSVQVRNGQLPCGVNRLDFFSEKVMMLGG